MWFFLSWRVTADTPTAVWWLCFRIRKLHLLPVVLMPCQVFKQLASWDGPSDNVPLFQSPPGGCVKPSGDPHDWPIHTPLVFFWRKSSWVHLWWHVCWKANQSHLSTSMVATWIGLPRGVRSLSRSSRILLLFSPQVLCFARSLSGDHEPLWVLTFRDS